MTNTAGPNTFLQRIIGAAALDPAIYEEVEADRSAAGQAIVIVLASSISIGIGVHGAVASSVAFFSALALVSWAAWALVMFEVGARILPAPGTRTNVGELLRTIGFATTPGLAGILAVIPGSAIPVFVLVWAWMLAAMVVGIRHALDYRSTARAVAVCALGGLLAVILAVAIGVMFGPAVS